MFDAIESVVGTLIAVFVAIAAVRGTFGEARTEKWITKAISNSNARKAAVAILLLIFQAAATIVFQALAKWSWSLESDPFLKIWVVAVNAGALCMFTVVIGFTGVQIRNRFQKTASNDSDPGEESIIESPSRNHSARTPIAEEVVHQKMLYDYTRTDLLQLIARKDKEGWKQVGPIGKDERGLFAVPVEKREMVYKKSSNPGMQFLVE